MFLVVNPHSANGSTGRRWLQLSARISQVLGPFQYAFTDSAMHATSLTKKALKEGFECVVAVGGDGTLNEVVNGFFEDGKTIHSEACLGLLPLGTGGDFRRSLGLDLDVSKNLERLKNAPVRPLDVGRMEFRNSDGRPSTRYFVNIASFGVSGQVAVEVNQSSKFLGGRASFMLGSMRALWRYRDVRVRLTLDGKPLEEMPITTVAVANGRYFGGGMKVAPRAELADGLLDVTVWQGYGLSDFVFKSSAIYDGTHTRFEGTRQFQCRSLLAESDEEVLIDCDGEQPGRLPCKMEVLPSVLHLKA